MAYIYKITNDINLKSYIGKTYLTIQKRFKEHCADYKRERCKNRPLYAAMNKYGIEHFHIEEIEQTDNPEERERYWIEYYGTFKNGYNATSGGDGQPYCDYELVYQLYKENKTIKEIACLLHYDEGTCSKILNNYNISHKEKEERRLQSISKMVYQLDKDTEKILAIYPSITAALQALNKNIHSSHISQVCSGKHKTAYGYKWRYA